MSERLTEAILQEEYELDRMRVRETFHFGGWIWQAAPAQCRLCLKSWISRS